MAWNSLLYEETAEGRQQQQQRRLVRIESTYKMSTETTTYKKSSLFCKFSENFAPSRRHVVCDGWGWDVGGREKDCINKLWWMKMSTSFLRLCYSGSDDKISIWAASDNDGDEWRGLREAGWYFDLTRAVDDSPDDDWRDGLWKFRELFGWVGLGYKYQNGSNLIDWCDN